MEIALNPILNDSHAIKSIQNLNYAYNCWSF